MSLAPQPSPIYKALLAAAMTAVNPPQLIPFGEEFAGPKSPGPRACPLHPKMGHSRQDPICPGIFPLLLYFVQTGGHYTCPIEREEFYTLGRKINAKSQKNKKHPFGLYPNRCPKFWPAKRHGGHRGRPPRGSSPTQRTTCRGQTPYRSGPPHFPALVIFKGDPPALSSPPPGPHGS